MSMLVGFAERGIRPDMIVFSDVGSEKDATYACLAPVRRWLESVGFPELVVVRRAPPTAPYATLYGNCLANDSPPSIATRGGDRGSASCSVEWKKKVIDRLVERWRPAVDARELGVPVVRAVGYDDSCADRKRRQASDKIDARRALPVVMAVGFDDSCADKGRRARADRINAAATKTAHWFPLQDWGWERQQCEAAIAASTLGDHLEQATGSRVPPKSSCVMCAAMKKREVLDLARTEPENMLRCLVLELRAKEGKNLFRRPGLGINWSWSSFLEAHADEPGLGWVKRWKAHAIERGWLPVDWDDYAAHVKATKPEDPVERKAWSKQTWSPDRATRVDGVLHAHPAEPQGSGLAFVKKGPSLEVAASAEFLAGMVEKKSRRLRVVK